MWRIGSLMAAAPLGLPPLFSGRVAGSAVFLTGTVTELWVISALLIAGIVIGALILTALSIALDQRDGRDD